MKRSAALLSLALVAILAAQGGKPVIQDAEGKKVVFEGWKGMKLETQKDGTLRVLITPQPGGLVRLNWKIEQTVLTAKEMRAQITKSYQLIQASLSGGIEVNATRPSSVAGNSQTIDIDASSATYVHARREVAVEGRFSVVRADKAAGESMTASGDGGGTITLSESGSAENALQAAVLRGPVNFAMTGRREEEGKRVPFNLKGRGDRLTYDGDKRLIVLSGNVNLSGDDPTLAGEMKGIAKAIITLTETGEVDSLELEGNPGSTTITPKEKVPPPGKR